MSLSCLFSDFKVPRNPGELGYLIRVFFTKCFIPSWSSEMFIVFPSLIAK